MEEPLAARKTKIAKRRYREYRGLEGEEIEHGEAKKSEKQRVEGIQERTAPPVHRSLDGAASKQHVQHMARKVRTSKYDKGI